MGSDRIASIGVLLVLVVLVGSIISCLPLFLSHAFARKPLLHILGVLFPLGLTWLSEWRAMLCVSDTFALPRIESILAVLKSLLQLSKICHFDMNNYFCS
jgi:hypothetical protein